MSTPPPEAPISARDFDVLRRWQLARTVYDLVASSPSEWCLRIGIYGRWGEGKTTILNFIEALARKDGYPVAWFNPWAVKDRQQLWACFAESIAKAFNAPLTSKTKLKTFASKTKEYLKLGEPVSELLPYGKVFKETASLLINGISVNKSDVEAQLSRETLGTKKLVILIDDLDRAQPDLVLHLLLALREVFDLRQCAFIAGLDPEIVAKALPKIHPGWDPTPEFLEKIFDFSFWLPSLTKADVLKLADAELQASAVKVDQNALEEVADLLPKNPRKLKYFIRGFWRFKGQINRHRDDEIDWIQLLLLDLMRVISARTTQVLIGNKLLWKELLTSSFAAKRLETGSSPESEDPKWVTLAKADIEKVGELGNQDTADLLQLLEAVRNLVSIERWDNLQYWARLADEPPVFTWKEFDELFAKLEAGTSVQKLENLIEDHAKARELAVSVVERDLFRTTIKHREGELALAAEGHSHAEMTEHLETTKKDLSLLKILAHDLEGFSCEQPFLLPTDFEELFLHFKKWAHFTNDPLYVELRELESEMLLNTPGFKPSFAIEFLNNIKAWSTLERETYEEAERLKEYLVAKLLPAVFSDLLDRFARKGGIKTLWPEGQHLFEKYVLFNRESGLYSEGTLDQLSRLSEEANRNDSIHENFLEFILMLDAGLSRGLTVLAPDDIRPLARDERLISLMWKGAIAKRVQPRASGSLEKARKQLAVELGGEERLPVPIWAKD